MAKQQQMDCSPLQALHVLSLRLDRTNHCDRLQSRHDISGVHTQEATLCGLLVSTHEETDWWRRQVKDVSVYSLAWALFAAL